MIKIDKVMKYTFSNVVPYIFSTSMHPLLLVILMKILFED